MHPKLVVVVVIDQFRAEYLQRFAPWFGDDGFKALTRGGAVFTQAHHRHGTTYTGPGHASIASGSYGYRHGIVGNYWYNPASGKREGILYDPEHPLVGCIRLDSDADNSPARFLATSLSDQLQLTYPTSRAVSIAVKDRAAVLLGGKLGSSYWFSGETGGLTTSTYYRNDLPGWLVRFNSRHIPDSYYGKRWEPLLPASAYQIMADRGNEHATELKGFGRSFPHTLSSKSGKPDEAFYEAFTTTPHANAYELQAAEAAIEGEQLGRHSTPDILNISLTANDYIGHTFGPDSREVMDATVATDRHLADFRAWINQRFKPGEVVWALTADHGATPVPEVAREHGLPASRIRRVTLREAISKALVQAYGPGDWIVGLEDPSLYLNHKLIRDKGLDPAAVERVAAHAADELPTVAAAWTRSQFIDGGLPDTELARMYARAFHVRHSGDVVIVPEPYCFWGKHAEKDTGSTHGSPYSYDTHVPLIIAGAGVRPGSYTFPVEIVDLAPTLAHLIGINEPSCSEGRVLHQALTGGEGRREEIVREIRVLHGAQSRSVRVQVETR